MLTLLWTHPQANLSVQWIVAASNVRLRSTPQTDAQILAILPFGTIVTQSEISSDRAWYRVTAPGGTSGWVSGSLIQPFNEHDRTDVYRRIIQGRLKLDSLTFVEASELSEFVDRTVSQVESKSRPEFELFRLNALARAAARINRYEPDNAAQRDWIKKHEDLIAYSEPAGEWLVRADWYWELEKKYHADAIAGQIAWDAANTGIPGECEGYLPCHFAILLLTDARYLDLYPRGVHAIEASDRIESFLREVTKPNTPYTAEAADARQLRESIVEVSRILQRISSPKQAEMLQLLRRVEAMFAASKNEE